jgi:hypothetical protein
VVDHADGVRHMAVNIVPNPPNRILAIKARKKPDVLSDN